MTVCNQFVDTSFEPLEKMIPNLCVHHNISYVIELYQFGLYEGKFVSQKMLQFGGQFVDGVLRLLYFHNLIRFLTQS